MEENLSPDQRDHPEKSKASTRRDFLKNIGLAGVGTVAGAAALYSGHIFEAKKESSGQNKILLTQDGKLVEVDSLELKALEKSPLDQNQYHGREGIPGKRWVMVTDLSRCRNARRCIAACQEAHHLRPEQYHMNTLQMQDSPNTAPYHMPKNCQHCDNPPCVSVCPVDATYKRQDGVVLIDNVRCIGCRFCMAACPYSARIFQWITPKYAEPDKDLTYNVELNVPQKLGTISKCLFSADRLREGKLPYCVTACPNSVYYFGDENEDAVTNGTTKETVRLSKLLRDNGGYQLMPELGTKPRVYYLPPKNRLFPFEATGETKPAIS
ncbi:MAG: 4Fe-4S dicluster domain-containing protein [Bacteroidales bacterium]|jgi:molybdopterin-containing oxidoreductase family iron-sulfur binding subunit|nr:4Fe-4S dicluster domain-containing protein [Bacteroidales bacterium]